MDAVEAPVLPTFFPVTGFGGSGTRAIALLLDKAGVFMASGGGESQCHTSKPIPYEACVRTERDWNRPCSDAQVDFHWKNPTDLRQTLRKISRAEEPDAICYKPVPDKEWSDTHQHSIQFQYKHIVARTRWCVKQPFTSKRFAPGSYMGHHSRFRLPADWVWPANPWFNTTITRVGFKHARPLEVVPHFAQWSARTHVDVRYVIVLRDARDLALGASRGAWKAMNMSAARLGVALPNSNQHYRRTHEDSLVAARTWSETHLKVLECATSLLKTFAVVRIEDFATADLQIRRANVAKLLMDLGIPFDGAKLTELANVMGTPIDAPADYLTTHYGRWKHVLDDEWAAQFFEAVRPALEAFEYELDGLHIKPKDNTAMLPRWLAMQEAAAASAV